MDFEASKIITPPLYGGGVIGYITNDISIRGIYGINRTCLLTTILDIYLCIRFNHSMLL